MRAAERSVGAAREPVAAREGAGRGPAKPAAGQEEKQAFAEYLARHRLKRSEQRDVILDAFLRAGRHLSVDDLLQIVQKKRPDIGRTTVYRTLKLLRAAGLASELALKGETRFESDWNREHHDHLICSECGEIIEFSSPEVERIQEEVAAANGFLIEGHRHQIYGRCRRCAVRAPRSAARRPSP